MTAGRPFIPPPTEARLQALVGGMTGELISTRRRVHQRPELAFHEVRTADLVARRCRRLGFEVRTGVGATGVLADLDSGQPGPTLLVRADMDAVPVEEGHTARPWRSRVPGIMHACGHDGHVAIGLGVATALARLRGAWAGRVRMCFQPAEETDAGAKAMIADGALDGVHVAVGIHLQAGLPTGTVAIGPGPQWASSDELLVAIRGVGGHAGDPQGTVDPIVVAAEVILQLRRVATAAARSRPIVLTVAQVHAGTAANVLPETAALSGTLRTFSEDDRSLVLTEVRRVVDRIASAHGAEASVTTGADCPAVRCDAGVTEIVRSVLVAASGEAGVTAGVPSTACDDMGRFLDAVPGCYFRVGATDPDSEVVHPHHHPLFDLDERSLPAGVGALTRAALALLGPR